MAAFRTCAPGIVTTVSGRSTLRRASCVQVCAGLKLYSNPQSRGLIVEWYIKELGVIEDVELVNLDMQDKQEHKSDWFKKINPFAKVPALEDGELILFESGAILMYLADKYGKLPDAAARARAAQWALFANSTMANSVFVEQFRARAMPDIFSTLDALLASQPYLEGDDLSFADVVVGSYLLYIPVMLPQVDLSPYPNVLAYIKMLAERPACAATVAAPRPKKN